METPFILQPSYFILVSTRTVGWRNVDPNGSASYNVVMESNGQTIPLTSAPVTGETVTLTGTNVATAPWCNEVPGGGTETLSVVAVDTGASAGVALPPGACYDNQTGIAWVYSWQYYATDHLGTVRAVYDGETGITQTFAYEPFGVEIPGAIPDTCDNTHRFTGHERDAETGNDYMHYRYFSANMARFSKPDNAQGQPTNPQLLNLYVYVRNNPIVAGDPTGHDAWTADFKYSVPKEQIEAAQNIAAKAPVTTADKIMMVPVLAVGVMEGAALLAIAGPACAAVLSKEAVTAISTKVGLGALGGAISDRNNPMKGFVAGTVGGLASAVVPGTSAASNAVSAAVGSTVSQGIDSGNVDAEKVGLSMVGSLIMDAGAALGGLPSGSQEVVPAAAAAAVDLLDSSVTDNGQVYGETLDQGTGEMVQ